jgi:hypothetical protein
MAVAYHATVHSRFNFIQRMRHVRNILPIAYIILIADTLYANICTNNKRISHRYTKARELLESCETTCNTGQAPVLSSGGSTSTEKCAVMESTYFSNTAQCPWCSFNTLGRRLTTDFRSDWQVVSRSVRMSVIYSLTVFLGGLCCRMLP